MSFIKYEIKAGVATLTLQRAAVRNALNRELLVEFHAVLDRLQRTDSGVRALVVTGAGSVFCSGVDLHTVDLSTPEARQKAHFAIRTMLDPLISRLSDYRYPIIAAVNGPAVGAGMSLAVATDIIVASHESYFSPSFIKMGLIPDAGIVYHLARRIGGGRSLSALLLAEKITPQTALDWGLVHEVVPTEQVLIRAVALAQRLAEGPTSAIRSLRSLHASAFTATINDYLAKEKWIQMDSVGNGECVEGVRAFFEKRDPVFHK
jgi:2-(1,2-epoxy-1,2-dihydrophenyl)acetyl-CoA isomerase